MNIEQWTDEASKTAELVAAKLGAIVTKSNVPPELDSQEFGGTSFYIDSKNSHQLLVLTRYKRSSETIVVCSKEEPIDPKVKHLLDELCAITNTEMVTQKILS